MLVRDHVRRGVVWGAIYLHERAANSAEAPGNQPHHPSPCALQLPLLLDGIASRPPQHAKIALRCVTAALAALGPSATASLSSVTAGAGGVSGGPPTARLLPAGAADRAALLEHLTRLLLYQRPSVDAPRTPLAAATAAAAAAAAPQVGRFERSTALLHGWQASPGLAAIALVLQGLDWATFSRFLCAQPPSHVLTQRLMCRLPLAQSRLQHRRLCQAYRLPTWQAWRRRASLTPGP